MPRHSALEAKDDWEPEPQVTRQPSRELPLKWNLLGLAFLLAFQLLQLASRIGRETRPPEWDQAVQMEISLDYRKAIAAGEWGTLLTLRLKPGMPPFPPLYHLTMLFAHDEANPAAAALWANFLYMAILCFSMWGLGRRFGGDWAGLAAAALLACSPAVQWLYGTQLLDLALTAWVAAAYWALFSSRNFFRWGPSLGFGALLAAAMLTKWTAFTFFLPAVWIAARALRNPSSRRQALAAFALPAVLIAPWYIVQFSVLLPRLIEGAADNAVPFWKGWAIFSYPRQMIVGFETPLFLLGLAALAAPAAAKRREDQAVLLGWLLSSFIFWTIVPNRQLRYILPGLPPFVLLAASVWRSQVLAGLCGYQLLSAANYSFGFIPYLSWTFFFLPLSFFVSDPPRSEDWKIIPVLQEAARLHEPGLPFGNLALVANHPYFNGHNFNWAVKQAGIENLRIRGVSRRLCEFAEFVVVKTGSLGPAGVVNQLPEVQRVMLDPAGWFARGYRPARRWPLPDGTQAVLFKRVKLDAPPVRERKARYQYFEDHGFAAEDLSIDLGDFDRARGVYPLARVRARRINVRGLAIDAPAFELEDLALIPFEGPETQRRGAPRDSLLDFRFLRMKRLRLVSAAVDERSAAAFLQARVKGVSGARFTLDKTVSAAAAVRGIPVSAELAAALAPGGRGLVLELRKLRLFGLPFPRLLLGKLARYELGFTPSPDLPFELDVPGLAISGGRLTVGSL